MEPVSIKFIGWETFKIGEKRFLALSMPNLGGSYPPKLIIDEMHTNFGSWEDNESFKKSFRESGMALSLGTGR
jgi:hypothetical protein